MLNILLASSILLTTTIAAATTHTLDALETHTNPKHQSNRVGGYPVPVDTLPETLLLDDDTVFEALEPDNRALTQKIKLAIIKGSDTITPNSDEDGAMSRPFAANEA